MLNRLQLDGGGRWASVSERGHLRYIVYTATSTVASDITKPVLIRYHLIAILFCKL